MDKNVLEVFFDYSCPFCLRGHEDLLAVLNKAPNVTIKWLPVEAHPHPEGGPHTDVMHQALLFAMEQNIDIMPFHERMYEALHTDRIDRENIDVLVEYLKEYLAPDALREALASKRYEAAQMGVNDYAYEESGVWALPSFRLNGGKLDSIEMVGVTREQIGEFLEKYAD